MIITRLLFYSGQMSNNNLFLASDLNLGLVTNAFSKHTEKHTGLLTYLQSGEKEFIIF